MMRPALLALLTVALVTASDAHAELQRCAVNGRIEFSDRPCRRTAGEVVALRDDTPDEAVSGAAVQDLAETQAPGDQRAAAAVRLRRTAGSVRHINRQRLRAQPRRQPGLPHQRRQHRDIERPRTAPRHYSVARIISSQSRVSSATSAMAAS
jgi:hypothetical protein